MLAATAEGHLKSGSTLFAETGRFPGRFQDACWTCHRAGRPTEGCVHQVCRGCKMARYCGHACQKRDWAEHKKVCARCLELAPVVKVVAAPWSEAPLFSRRRDFETSSLGYLRNLSPLDADELGDGSWSFSRLCDSAPRCWLWGRGLLLWEKRMWSAWQVKNVAATDDILNLVKPRAVMDALLESAAEVVNESLYGRLIVSTVAPRTLRRLAFVSAQLGMGIILYTELRSRQVAALCEAGADHAYQGAYLLMPGEAVPAHMASGLKGVLTIGLAPARACWEVTKDGAWRQRARVYPPP